MIKSKHEKRSESFDKYVEQQMQDLDYAKETLLMSIKEFDEPVEEVLMNFYLYSTLDQNFQ